MYCPECGMSGAKNRSQPIKVVVEGHAVEVKNCLAWSCSHCGTERAPSLDVRRVRAVKPGGHDGGASGDDIRNAVGEYTIDRFAATIGTTRSTVYSWMKSGVSHSPSECLVWLINEDRETLYKLNERLG